MSKLQVLFVCIENVGRSQMAEGFFREYAPKFEVVSAGTEPKSELNPFVVEAMNEIGIDISNNKSTNVNDLLTEKFDLVITLCDNARESCPLFPGNVELIHIGFSDPAFFKGTDEEVILIFRELREKIQEKLLTFLKNKFFII